MELAMREKTEKRTNEGVERAGNRETSNNSKRKETYLLLVKNKKKHLESL